MSSKVNLGSRLLSGLKTRWQKIPWTEIRNIMRVHRHFVKYDNMPPNAKLIYNIPFAHYFINSYMAAIPVGPGFVLGSLAYYNTNFFSLTDEDFKQHPYLNKPIEYYVLLCGSVAFSLAMFKVIHDFPIRIYRLQNNQYTALFINKILPLRVTRYNFEQVSKPKVLKFGPWHDSIHLLDNTRRVKLFDHRVVPPIEYFQMMTPKNLRKS